MVTPMVVGITHGNMASKIAPYFSENGNARENITKGKNPITGGSGIVNPRANARNLLSQTLFITSNATSPGDWCGRGVKSSNEGVA